MSITIYHGDETDEFVLDPVYCAHSGASGSSGTSGLLVCDAMPYVDICPTGIVAAAEFETL